MVIISGYISSRLFKDNCKRVKKRVMSGEGG